MLAPLLAHSAAFGHAPCLRFSFALPPAVVERRTTAAGAEYVRLVLGTAGGAAAEVDDPSAVLDCEFLFIASEAAGWRTGHAPDRAAGLCVCTRGGGMAAGK